MAVEVYFWFPHPPDVGHASMKVTGGTPAGTMYLSRWPGSMTEVITIGPGGDHRYLDDVAAEHGLPTVVRLTKLNETAIKKAIVDAHTRNLYSFLLLNCSTQVKKCLDAGLAGSMLLNTALRLGPGALISYQLDDTPWGLYRYVRLVQALTR